MIKGNAKEKKPAGKIVKKGLFSVLSKNTKKSAQVQSDEKALQILENNVLAKRNPTRNMLKIYVAERKEILDFVNSNLIDGIDYGHTAFDNDGNPRGKPSLKKPGAEKICIYLQLDPVFVADTETINMLSIKGMVSYICFLIPRHNKSEILKQLKLLGKDNEIAIYRALCFAEGRGGYTIKQTYKGDERVNTVIKMGEKSAQIDAVLRVEGLSEMFTQDMEDYQEIKQTPEKKNFKSEKQAPRNVTPETKKEKKEKPEAVKQETKLNEADKEYIEKYYTHLIAGLDEMFKQKLIVAYGYDVEKAEIEELYKAKNVKKLRVKYLEIKEKYKKAKQKKSSDTSKEKNKKEKEETGKDIY